MFSPSRNDARQLFFDAWRKHREGRPLTALEGMALDVLLAHPEYHRVMDDPDTYRYRDYPPELGETNPFLHLSMHLAVAEQLSIDQPPGIRAAYRRLLARNGQPHEALHAVLECLAETIWQAQRAGTGPDGQAYLDCLAQR